VGGWELGGGGGSGSGGGGGRSGGGSGGGLDGAIVAARKTVQMSVVPVLYVYGGTTAPSLRASTQPRGGLQCPEPSP